MTKQEQIVEMTQIICGSCKDGICLIDKTSCTRDCSNKSLEESEALYSAGYRKINEIELECENASLTVENEVLKRDIQNLERTLEEVKADEVRKETAKEFAEKLKEICVRKREFIDIDDDEEEYYFDGAVTINEIDELLKQYGVEEKQ